MKNITKTILPLVLASFLFAGCASYNLYSLAGTNIEDLEAARGQGKNKVFSLSYDTAFSKTTEILKNNGLIIFKSNRGKKYIVAMGFHKQTDTTRVGIFFDPLADGKTEITLSSLSSTALAKAVTIIFGGLQS
ncbi:hypothetical protein ACFL5Y_03080 [Candidatus Omnitrophota bacterium]